MLAFVAADPYAQEAKKLSKAQADMAEIEAGRLAQKAAKSNMPHIKVHLDEAKQVLGRLDGPRPTKGSEKSE